MNQKTMTPGNKGVVSVEDVIEMSGVETLHPGGLDLSRRIADLVKFSPSMNILDVSSGKGVFASLYAKEYGCRVTGIDINEKFVDIARRRAEGDGVTGLVKFDIGDSRKLPYANNSFDVSANECAVGLTAINDPQQVLNEMVRVTKKGGKVIIHESTWLKDYPVNSKREIAAAMGTTPYTVEEWKLMLAKAGAKAETVEDWSGMENARKMRPGFKWSDRNPLDFLTVGEKMRLFPKIFFRHGIGAVTYLNRNKKILTDLYRNGYLGYVLIIAVK